MVISRANRTHTSFGVRLAPDMHGVVRGEPKPMARVAVFVEVGALRVSGLTGQGSRRRQPKDWSTADRDSFGPARGHHVQALPQWLSS